MPLPLAGQSGAQICSGILGDVSSYSCTNMVGINAPAGYWLRVGGVRHSWAQGTELDRLFRQGRQDAEAFAELVALLTGNRLTTSAAMITSGAAIAYVSGLAVMYAVGAGPVAWPIIPIAAGVGAVGTGMAVEGAGYLITGRLLLLEKLVAAIAEKNVPRH